MTTRESSSAQRCSRECCQHSMHLEDHYTSHNAIIIGFREQTSSGFVQCMHTHQQWIVVKTFQLAKSILHWRDAIICTCKTEAWWRARNRVYHLLHFRHPGWTQSHPIKIHSMGCYHAIRCIHPGREGRNVVARMHYVGERRAENSH